MTPPLRTAVLSCSILLLLALAGACRREPPAAARSPVALSQPLRLVLAEHSGSAALDDGIRTAQQRVRTRAGVAELESLAALFIGKARSAGDPGFYTLAEACADAMPAGEAGPAADLIRGHVRHALHDFVDAEAIARRLVADRGMFLDHGLLGDVLLDRGRFREARDAYQQMLDQRPCLQSYARAAQVRWLMGDVEGCRRLLDTAAGAGSRKVPEPLAWVLSRRAALELQADDSTLALDYAEQALAELADYPAALLWRGRAALARGDDDLAVRSLTAAAARSPLPEYLWALAEALRRSGDPAAATETEERLAATGEREDARTFALWLATTDRDAARAVRIAQGELQLRQDVYTFDTLALARLRAGDLGGAQQAMHEALAIGTQDARLNVHAALIALAAGDRDAARHHVAAATRGRAALLPSEQRALADASAQL